MKRLSNARNPFQFGRELGLDELVDRRDELALVRRTIENGGKLFLIGPRRFGKTSILRAAEDELTAAGTTVLRIDAEAYESIDLLARALLITATRALSGSLERAGDLLRRFFGTLRPELTFDPTDQSFSVSLGNSGRGRDAELPTLVEVLDGIERLAAEAGRPVAVILDEFQHIVTEGGPAAERQLRAAVQRHEHVGYVFAGSKTRLLADMTGNPGRPFYNLGERHFVGPIPRDDFLAFLHDGFTATGFRVTDEALVAILDLAEDVPYNVQQLAHQCWETLRVTPGESLTRAAVAVARTRIVRANDPFYTKIWIDLRAPQKKAVKAVIREGGVDLYSASVSRRYRIPTATMQHALATLESDGVIRAVQQEGIVRYRLEDPFFATWLDAVQALKQPIRLNRDTGSAPERG